MNRGIVFVNADDWQGMYIDGRLSTEGHRLTVSEVLRILGISHENKEVDQEWIEQLGSLPNKIKDCKFTKE